MNVYYCPGWVTKFADGPGLVSVGTLCWLSSLKGHNNCLCKTHLKIQVKKFLSIVFFPGEKINSTLC